ncbi:hypothetical protein [Amycolatopsis samaneae]|uniref:Uncharacterized protein n=1 Tax=Amycolatopsis samaneae TaxID=664691 RepID=A0ABW5GLA5_9PSEU
MPLTTNLKRVALSSGTVGAAVAAAALLATPAASAAPAASGALKLCSQGNYPSTVEFPARGGFSTFVINPGQCHTTTGLGDRDSYEDINVYGFDGAGNRFGAGSGHFNPHRGGNVITYGTPGNAWALTPS